MLLCLIVFALVCCGGSVPSERVLSEMLKASSSLPSGKTYTTDSSPGSGDHLSESLFSSMFFEDADVSVYGRIKTGAVWLSSGLFAAEAAVFECNSRRDLEEISDLCFRRIENIKRLVNANSDSLGISEAAKAKLAGAKVSIIGRYVIMVIDEHSDEMIEAAKEIIS